MSRLALLGLLCTSVLLGACGAPARKSASNNSPASSASAPAENTPARQIETGPLEVTGRDEQGNIRFVIRSSGSRVRLEGDALSTGTLPDVAGVLYNGKEKASDIRADLATADDTKGTLTLTGNVRVTGTASGATLRAERLVYNKTSGKIEASGSVRLTRGALSMGPMARVFATSDLKTVGTPGVF